MRRVEQCGRRIRYPFLGSLGPGADGNRVRRKLGEAVFFAQPQKRRSRLPAAGEMPLNFLASNPYMREIPDDIADEIWYQSRLSLSDKVAAFDVYVHVPASQLIAYSVDYLRDMPSPVADEYWARFCGIADEDSDIWRPLLYVLREYIFERSDLVQDAWRNGTADLSRERLLRLRHPHSGAVLVPMPLKVDGIDGY